MKLKLLHDPKSGSLKIIGFMSGLGSNLRKILEAQSGNYEVVAIFSDSWDSHACEIGRDFDVPVICKDIRGFYNKKNKPRGDLRIREEFDQQVVELLWPFQAQVIAYAGYMSVVTRPLINSYLGINVHPADLSIEENGQRKYVGGWALRQAIENGEKSVRATTHIVEPCVDGGRILMISKEVGISGQAHLIQERLKREGDWVIFPLTLEYLAEGKYAEDSTGNLYFEDQPIPKGVQL